MKTCEYCAKELPSNKQHNRFCNRSCSNSWQHSVGLRRDYINDKKTYEWWLEKYGEEGAKQKLEQFKQKISSVTAGDKNPMYGRHDQTHGWKRENQRRKGKTSEQIYGKEKAEEIRTKKSLAASGAKNPAYGKVYDNVGKSPYQGWYNGILFRSSYELTFLVEQFKLNPTVRIIAEPVSIPYDSGQHTYRPDYQIDNVIYEIKPKLLVSHRSNSSKLEAGRQFCETNGLQFEIVTEDTLGKILSEQEMLALGNVKWSKRCMKAKNLSPSP